MAARTSATSTGCSSSCLPRPPLLPSTRRPRRAAMAVAPKDKGHLQNFGCSLHVKRFGSEMIKNGIHKIFNIQTRAYNGRGFGAGPGNKKRIKSKKRLKDVSPEPSKITSGDAKNRDEQAADLSIRGDKKSSNVVMDKQFLEKVEAVRRSALEKKKADENKVYQAIDYDAPVESDQSTIGFGTKVGIGIAVVVFGLVFAFGDFLPYGSPSKESVVVDRKLSEEEKSSFKRALEGFEATLSKSPNDPTALEGAAVTLVELGEYEKALPLLEKLVKEIPDKAEAYRLIGEVKYELKDYDGSASSYKNSLSSSDNIDFEVLRGLTNSLLAAKRSDQAVEVLLSCRQKLNEKGQTLRANLEGLNDSGSQKPQDVDPIQVDLLLGKAYSDWGHISDAVAVYDKLINEHPDDFRGYLAKGIILKENGNVGDAERMFIQAKFFAPEAGKALVDRYSQR